MLECRANMTVTRARSTAQVAQSAAQSSPTKLPAAWEKGKAHVPDSRLWDKFRNDLCGPGATPKRTATTADVDRVIARAEKNGLSPQELLSLMSIKSTQHMYFEGKSDGAAWKKLNNWVGDNYWNPAPRANQEFSRRLTGGQLDAAGAKKLMAWVRAENTDQGAAAMKRAVLSNDAKLTPDARATLTAFFAKVPTPSGWSPTS